MLKYTYTQIDTRDPIALLSKLSYELKNGWSKILKGFVPLFVTSGFRN